MEDILFDSYRKYLKEKQPGVVKAFFGMPLGAKLLLLGITLCVGASIVLFWFTKWKLICLMVLLGLEIILCIISYFYVENYQIKTSNVRVIEYKEYCKGIVEWLKSNDIEVSKSNLTELRKRILASVESRECTRKKNIERVEKWLQTLFIPLLLAVFAKIIDGQSEVSTLIGSMIVLIVAIGGLGAVTINCYNMVSFFKKRKLEQMIRFASDLQGAIDTQFEDGLIKKVTLETKV